MRVSLLLLTCAASVSLAPAVAQAGFFESLFGLAPAPAQAPAAARPVSPERGSSRHARRRDYEPREHRHQEHRKVAAAQERASKVKAGPKLQRTTGLMDDRTLRAGDAVMTKDGLRIFTGGEADHHVVAEFVPLRAAKRERKGVRLALATIDDAARLDIGRDRRPELQTGRSVVEAAERRPSFTDANVSVRYVGP